MNKKKIREVIEERIKEVIKENAVEQDNQGYQDIGMINEEGLKQVVKEITDYLIGAMKEVIDIYKSSWGKIGKTKKGEGVYYNAITEETAIEKDFYLVESGEEK